LQAVSFVLPLQVAQSRVVESQKNPGAQAHSPSTMIAAGSTAPAPAAEQSCVHAGVAASNNQFGQVVDSQSASTAGIMVEQLWQVPATPAPLAQVKSMLQVQVFKPNLASLTALLVSRTSLQREHLVVP
jgi:hypothetical protein